MACRDGPDSREEARDSRRTFNFAQDSSASVLFWGFWGSRFGGRGCTLHAQVCLRRKWCNVQPRPRLLRLRRLSPEGVYDVGYSTEGRRRRTKQLPKGASPTQSEAYRCEFYATSRPCFLRTRGSFFPSTTARLITTPLMSSLEGISYIRSSIKRSSIARRARAPVPFWIAFWARA